VGDWVNEEFEDEWAERATAQSCSLPVQRRTDQHSREIWQGSERISMSSLGTDQRGSVGDCLRDGIIDLQQGNSES
jgi:hypothetical protein